MRETRNLFESLNSDEPALEVPPAWREALKAELLSPWIVDLARFVETERKTHEVFPPEAEVFTALRLVAPSEVKVVLLGQDPYHGAGQAHGLCFSVNKGIALPPSLVNIFKELKTDLGIDAPRHGSLVGWAKQGVLLLNTVLTVRAGEANSHKGKGWERLTDGVIRAVSAGPNRVVFILWGGHAQKKTPLIDVSRHVIIASAHPSPLSARNGFFGSRPFSKANKALSAFHRPPIDWRL